jgi:transposase-like protein
VEEKMVEIKKQYRADFKFQLALEAAKGNKTLGQLASESGVHPNQIGQWKKQLLAGGLSLFAKPNSAGEKAREVFQAALYEQIGRLKMELEWLKKKAARFS